MLRPITLALAIVSLTGFFSATAGPSFADGELQVAVSDIETTYPLVRFIATVTDQGGRTLASLNPQDFSASGRGKAIPTASVQSLSDANIGVSSLLLIDTSGSMAGPPIAAARDSALQFLDGQKTVDEVAVMTFADTVSLVSGYTNDFDGLRASLNGLAARGNTALYQSVADAATTARARSKERRVILLVSDGADFGGLSRVNRQQSLNAARDAGIPFYVIGLGPDIDRQYLIDLATASKGRLYLAPDASQLRALYSEITTLVRTHYVVTLDLTYTDLEGEVPVRLLVKSGERSGSAEFQLNLPVTAPVPLEPAAPKPAPAAKGSPAWPLFLILPLALLGVVVYLARRRFMPARLGPSTANLPAVFDSYANRAPPKTPPSTRTVLAVLNLEDGTSLDLTDSLVTIGTGADCGLKLPISEADFGQGSIRLWRSNGRYLLHDVSPRSRVQVNGRPVSWSYLDDGDRLNIRGVGMQFKLVGPTGISDP